MSPTIFAIEDSYTDDNSQQIHTIVAAMLIDVSLFSIKRDAPFGDDKWTRSTATRMDNESTIKSSGRPRDTF